MGDRKTYDTVDLYLGAFLKARRTKLLGVDRTERRVIFLFEDGPKGKVAVNVTRIEEESKD